MTLHLGIRTVWQSFVGQPVPCPGVTASHTALWHFPTLIQTTPPLTIRSTLPIQSLNMCTNCCVVFEHKIFPKTPINLRCAFPYAPSLKGETSRAHLYGIKRVDCIWGMYKSHSGSFCNGKSVMAGSNMESIVGLASRADWGDSCAMCDSLLQLVAGCGPQRMAMAARVQYEEESALLWVRNAFYT